MFFKKENLSFSNLFSRIGNNNKFENITVAEKFIQHITNYKTFNIDIKIKGVTPSPSDNFTGREKYIADIYKKLKEYSKVVLVGNGGMGYDKFLDM